MYRLGGRESKVVRVKRDVACSESQFKSEAGCRPAREEGAEKVLHERGTIFGASARQGAGEMSAYTSRDS